MSGEIINSDPIGCKAGYKQYKRN